jgi:hypothetical protein
MQISPTTPLDYRFGRWLFKNGPFVMICASVVLGIFILWAPGPGSKLCDSAVAELVAAHDQLSLDRAKFVIDHERCGIGKRTDRVSDAAK